MKRILTFFLTLSLSLILCAQGSFDPATMNTLSNNNITALACDEDGYMWIGTLRGLNRYNGSIYRKYYSSGGGG